MQQPSNSLLYQQQQHQHTSEQSEMNSVQDFRAITGSGRTQHHMSSSHFDSTAASNTDFLEHFLSSVPSSSPWPDLTKSQSPWDSHHLPNPNSAVDDHGYHFGDQSSALLASKLRQHQINGGDDGGGGCSSAAKALMLQQLLSRGFSGTGLMSPAGSVRENGLPGMPLSLGNREQNESIGNPVSDCSIQPIYNGFTGSLGQTSSQPHHFNHPPGGSMQGHNFGTPPPPPPPMDQPPAGTASGSTGGAGTAPAQPKQQRIRARRGQATDPHSIAERLRRERISERMKALQELVPNANKTDKASMLDEIIDYVKFLQLQVKVLSMSRLGGAAAVAPLISVGGGDCLQGNGAGRSSNGTQTASSSNNDSMTMTEQQVAKLMEEDMGSAMQYLQGKGLCLMPISLATVISTATCHTMNPVRNNPLLGGGQAGGGGPSSPSLSVLTVQSATTMGNGNGATDFSVKDAASVSNKS